MRCLAIPNVHFPPGDALVDADGVLAAIAQLDVAAIERLDRSSRDGELWPREPWPG
jgi:hypothetical protein